MDVVAPPELDITEGEESGDVTFEAIVEVRPTVTIEGYESLRVEVPSPQVTDDEIDAQVDRLRGQYGELSDVERQAGDGDYVTIDLRGSRDGEVVDGLEAEGYSYLIGSGAVVAAFDEQLLGVSAGEEVKFTAAHPDPSDEETVDYEITVGAVQERVLPDLTDEWVADATEFEGVAEFRNDTRTRLESGREDATRSSVRARVAAELAKLVEMEPPESMVSSDFQGRLQQMSGQLAQSGIAMEDYLRIMGKEPDTFAAELREAAEEGVLVDLALRAVAAAEGLEATEEELQDEVAEFIGDGDLSIEEGIAQLRDAGQLSAVRSEIANRKAMEWLIERAEVVDPEGLAIPPHLLTPPEHDHDHDHDDHDDHDHEDHDHDHAATETETDDTGDPEQ